MDLTETPRELEWADAAGCTLPTADRPLRLTEFDDLFANVVAIQTIGPTRARLLLTGDDQLAERAQRLADAETACCSFFTFLVTAGADGVVAFDVEVPPAYAEILAGILARAQISMGAAT